MNTARRQFLSLMSVTTVSAATWTSPVWANTYPSRPITLIVQAAAGGASDLVARMLGQKLGDELGASVVIENVPAAGGIVAVQKAIRSKPDGYTLLFCGSKSAIAESLFKTRPYTLTKEIALVGVVGSTDLALVVDAKSSPFKSVDDLVKKIKAQPGKITIGVGDTVGGIQHLGAELLKKAVQGDFLIVPYGSASKLSVAVQSGEVDAAFELLPSVVGLVNQGALRALATTGSQRSEVLPTVPTLKQAGIENADVTVNSFVAAPTGMPTEVLAKLNKAMNKVLSLPDYQSALRARSSNVGAAVTPLEAQALLNNEVNKWGEIIKAAKVPPQ